MLASLVIHLQPEDTYEINFPLNRSIQALFYEILKKGDSEVALACHDSNSVKPFTVSPLFGPFGRTSSKRLIVKGFNYWFRCAFLKQDIFDAFSKTIFPMSAGREQVSLSGKKFLVQHVELEKKKRFSWSNISSFSTLMKEAQETAQSLKSKLSCSIVLKFASPTTFRRGEINYLFPDPYLVFQSYTKKWNAFSEMPIDENLLIDYVNSSLVVSSYALKTDIFDIGDVALQGFKGFCRLSLLKFQKVYTPVVLALVKFAFYAGTGQKTTMGMGMTYPEIYVHK